MLVSKLARKQASSFVTNNLSTYLPSANVCRVKAHLSAYGITGVCEERIDVRNKVVIRGALLRTWHVYVDSSETK